MKKQDLRIAIIYFSATNVTRSYARVIHDKLSEFGHAPQLFDITQHIVRLTRLPLEQYDAFIFGFPVFADFVPSVVNQWLPTLNGMGKRCAQFFTYGARSSGHAHYHTFQLLQQANFRVQLSAEFLGRHTFNLAGWHIIPHRPDAEDFRLAEEFAEMALQRFIRDDEIELNLEKIDVYDQDLENLKNRKPKKKRGWTNPIRVKENCRMCRLCESQCPTLAFNADSGLSDPATCIECMHCVYICPDQALQADKRMKFGYRLFLRRHQLTEEIMNTKTGKIFQ